MSTFVIGLLLALGGGTWAFSQIQRRTGGNTRTALLFGAIAGFMLFLLSMIIFSFLPE